MSVSELRTVTASRGTPISSAAIIAITVSEPWPSSEAPLITVTAPASSTLTSVPQPSDG